MDESSEQERDRLINQVSPMLNDIARNFSMRSGAKRLRVDLIACDYRVGAADFSPEEMKQYLGYKVIAVFWKGTESDGQPGLVQLAIPVYMHVDGASRRDVEVVTIYSAPSWIEVLGQDASIYKPFVTMGLATVYEREKQDWIAWQALCDSRVGLATLASDSLRRPKRELLDSEITGRLAEQMKQLEQRARPAAPWPGCAKPPAAPQ